MNDDILAIIKDYANEKIIDPCPLYPENKFKRNSTVKEVIAYIYSQIADRPFCDIDDILWGCQMELEYFCRTCEREETLSIFRTMRDVVEDITEVIKRRTI